MSAFERTREVWVPEFLKHFEAKNADYSSRASASSPAFEPHRVLGLRGQFADIWRKVWKLKKALWDEESLTGEQPREIILDLIGHLFLTLDMLERSRKPKSSSGGLSGNMIEAGRRSLEGNSSILDEMGLKIKDVEGKVGCEKTCHEVGHSFIGGCRYRIGRGFA